MNFERAYQYANKYPRTDRRWQSAMVYYISRFCVMQVRALCCECGQLRTVSTRYQPRRDDNLSHFNDPRGWRATGALKCAHCQAKTRHALLQDQFPPVIRDSFEAEIMGWK